MYLEDDLSLPELLQDHHDEIEREMKALLDRRSLQLYRMMSYHLGWIDPQGTPLSPSSRPRLFANLCLASCEACGGDIAKAMPAAVSVEMLHNFYLVHDDLQNGVPQRDGRDTAWWVWGPAQAINIGDGMHAMSRLSLFSLRDRGFSDEKVFKALGMLDEAGLKMCEGQFLDITYQERVDVSPQSYLTMIEKRSGSLFECAFKLGALLSSSEVEIIESLGRFGAKLGIARQIQEDVQAIWGSEPARSRLRNGVINKKKSLPVVYGFQKAAVAHKRRLGEIYFKRVLESEDLETLVSILDEIGVRDDAQQMAERHLNQALDALKGAPLTSEAAEALKSLAHSLASGETYIP